MKFEKFNSILESRINCCAVADGDLIDIYRLYENEEPIFTFSVPEGYSLKLVEDIEDYYDIYMDEHNSEDSEPDITVASIDKIDNLIFNKLNTKIQPSDMDILLKLAELKHVLKASK